MSYGSGLKLAGAALPLSLGLTAASETAGAISDYRNGMSLGAAIGIHAVSGSGSVVGGISGAEAGFLVGEAFFPAGGGIVGALIGGAAGSYYGGQLAQKQARYQFAGCR